METNIITITNQVWLVTTNPVPVTIAGLDFDTQVSLFLGGFVAGLPFALVVFIIWIIAAALRPPHFPSSSGE